MSSDHAPVPTASPEDAALAPPPDAENLALIDARTTFIVLVVITALFVASVVVFIL